MQMTGNETVDQLIDFQPAAINIPHTWFKTIVNTKGKPNMNAIIILSEIVYWYRPTVVKDESTGEFIGYKKKFKADLLQKNRSGFSKAFGLSKDQVYTALKLLEELGVIKSVLRNVQYSDTILNNVRYIELNVKRLKELSYPVVGKREGYRADTIGVSYKNETNTSITSPSITSTKKDIVHSSNEQNNFESIWQMYPRKTKKKTALSSYLRAKKKGVKDQDIINGIEEYKKMMSLPENSWRSFQEGGTWFNQERWDDDYSNVQKVTSQVASSSLPAYEPDHIEEATFQWSKN